VTFGAATRAEVTALPSDAVSDTRIASGCATPESVTDPPVEAVGAPVIALRAAAGRA
jgi:hypothetical protein